MIARHIALLPAAAGALLLAGTACKTDVPVPEDPGAQEWTGSIKESYPGWQPTRQMPAGNEDYEALFDNTREKEGVLQTEKQKQESGGNEEDSRYPILYVDAPAVARIDITEEGTCLLDGALFPAPVIEKYLKKVAKTHKEASVVILRPVAGAPAQKVNELLDLCRDSGIASVSLMEDKKATGVSKIAKTGKAKLRVTVDTSKPVQTYKVKAGDTLSLISLKFYKNAACWNFIYQANRGILSNPNRLSPKMTLTIPALKITKDAL